MSSTHAESPRRILEEIARVLAPGGLLYFTVNVHHPVYHWAATAHSGWRALGIPLEITPFADHTVHLTLVSARRLLAGLPLRIVRQSDTVEETKRDGGAASGSPRRRPAQALVLQECALGGDCSPGAARSYIHDVSKADRPDHPGAAERFNEEQATYAVRGAEQPDLEAGVAAIREVLKTLPVAAGRLPHAGCARRRALRRQGAGAEEPRDQLHPGRASCRSGCSGWSRRRGR